MRDHVSTLTNVAKSPYLLHFKDNTEKEQSTTKNYEVSIGVAHKHGTWVYMSVKILKGTLALTIILMGEPHAPDFPSTTSQFAGRLSQRVQKWRKIYNYSNDWVPWNRNRIANLARKVNAKPMKDIYCPKELNRLSAYDVWTKLFYSPGNVFTDAIKFDI